MKKRFVTQKREPFFQIAKELIKLDSKVLDIGAGNGSFAKYCDRYDFYLMDGNPLNKILNSVFPNYVINQLPEIPFENSFFDIIHCSHVVEHLDSQCLYDSLIQINRCLKPNGYLIISAPLLTDFFYDDLSHVKPYNPAVFIKYLCDSNNENLTREVISKEFRVISLDYRYKAYKLYGENIFKPFYWLSSILFKLGLRKYSKTGYTLVLQKQHLTY